MPLPRPSRVSNLKIASMEVVPARVTQRGARAVRIDREARRRARASHALGNSFRIASAPFSVCIRQLSASTSRQ